MQIVLSRMMNIQLSPSLRLNLGFLPTAVAGMLNGSLLQYAGSGLRRSAGRGAFSCWERCSRALRSRRRWRASITACGSIAGAKLWRAALTILPVTLICNIGLNTLWLWTAPRQRRSGDLPGPRPQKHRPIPPQRSSPLPHHKACVSHRSEVRYSGGRFWEEAASLREAPPPQTPSPEERAGISLTLPTTCAPLQVGRVSQ